MRVAFVLACLLVSAPALAAGEPAASPASQSAEAVKASSYSVEETPIGDLLDDERARALLDKHIPGMTNNPNIDLARGSTLRGIQPFAPTQVTNEVLARLDAELKALPPK